MVTCGVRSDARAIGGKASVTGSVKPVPTSDRTQSTAAVVDVELAAWADENGISASTGQINRWRRAGLIPAPTVRGERPEGAPPGRRALGYTADARDQAHDAVAFLARHARRGRPPGDLALLLFAARLPVDHRLVVEGIRAQVSRVQAAIAKATTTAAGADVAPIDPSFRRDDTYERAEAAASRALLTRSPMARVIRSRLHGAHQPAGVQDLLSVLTGLFRLVLGDPPPRDDTEMLDHMLYAFGAHGLVEQLAPGIPAVMPEGPAGLSDALTTIVRSSMFSIPDDVGPDELVEVRDRIIVLGDALGSIPQEPVLLRHHLGGDAAFSLWEPDDPMKVAMILGSFLAILRETPLTDRDLVAAIRDLWPATPAPNVQRQDLRLELRDDLHERTEPTEEDSMTTRPTRRPQAKAGR